MLERLKRGWIPLLGIVLAVSGSVLTAAAISKWISDQARYDAFRAAPVCTEWPVSADSICVALEPTHVLSVQNFKGVSNVSVRGWPMLVYGTDPGFASGLRAGDAVDVVVWRGTVEGLESTADGADYLSDSAILAPTRDYALTVLGGMLLCLAGLCGVARLRRRGADSERMRALKWSLIAAAGLAVANVLGVILSDSLPGGLIGDGVLGLLTLLVVGLMQFLGIRGRVRIPAPPPRPARVPGMPTRPSVNARRRPRPRRRA